MNSLIPIFGLLAAMGSGLTIEIKGAVKSPATVEVSEPAHIRTVLRQSGGLCLNADTKRIAVHSACGATRTVDINRFDQDLMVKPGDRIEVPAADPKTHVFLDGAVQSRGAVELEPGADLRSVIEKAGVPSRASLSQVKIVRDVDGETRTMQVNLLKTYASVPVMPGDTITVPHGRTMATSDRELLTIVVIGLLILVLVSQ